MSDKIDIGTTSLIWGQRPKMEMTANTSHTYSCGWVMRWGRGSRKGWACTLSYRDCSECKLSVLLAHVTSLCAFRSSVANATSTHPTVFDDIIRRRMPPGSHHPQPGGRDRSPLWVSLDDPPMRPMFGIQDTPLPPPFFKNLDWLILVIMSPGIYEKVNSLITNSPIPFSVSNGKMDRYIMSMLFSC